MDGNVFFIMTETTMTLVFAATGLAVVIGMGVLVGRIFTGGKGRGRARYGRRTKKEEESGSKLGNICNCLVSLRHTVEPPI